MPFATHGRESLQSGLAEGGQAEAVEVGEGDVAQGGCRALAVDQLVLVSRVALLGYDASDRPLRLVAGVGVCWGDGRGEGDVVRVAPVHRLAGVQQDVDGKVFL